MGYWERYIRKWESQGKMSELRPTHSGVLLKNDEEEYLFQMRDGEAQWAPLSWAVFGGAVDEGESAVEAAKRELSEELDILVAEEDLEQVGNFSDKASDNIFIFRYNKLVNWGDFKVREGAGAAFFSVDELRQIDMPETTRFIVDNYLK